MKWLIEHYCGDILGLNFERLADGGTRPAVIMYNTGTLRLDAWSGSWDGTNLILRRKGWMVIRDDYATL